MHEQAPQHEAPVAHSATSGQQHGERPPRPPGREAALSASIGGLAAPSGRTPHQLVEQLRLGLAAAPPEEQGERAFALGDLDSDGSLDVMEFDLLVRKLGLQWDSTQVGTCFAQLDTSEDNRIQLSEWLAATAADDEVLPSVSLAKLEEPAPDVHPVWGAPRGDRLEASDRVQPASGGFAHAAADSALRGAFPPAVAERSAARAAVPDAAIVEMRATISGILGRLETLEHRVASQHTAPAEDKLWQYGVQEQTEELIAHVKALEMESGVPRKHGVERGRSTFVCGDANFDGMLDFSEFTRLVALLGLPWDPVQIARCFSDLDRNKNNSVNIAEWQTAINSSVGLKKARASLDARAVAGGADAGDAAVAKAPDSPTPPTDDTVQTVLALEAPAALETAESVTLRALIDELREDVCRLAQDVADERHERRAAVASLTTSISSTASELTLPKSMTSGLARGIGEIGIEVRNEMTRRLCSAVEELHAELRDGVAAARMSLQAELAQFAQLVHRSNRSKARAVSKPSPELCSVLAQTNSLLSSVLEEQAHDKVMPSVNSVATSELNKEAGITYRCNFEEPVVPQECQRVALPTMPPAMQDSDLLDNTYRQAVGSQERASSAASVYGQGTMAECEAAHQSSSFPMRHSVRSSQSVFSQVGQPLDSLFSSTYSYDRDGGEAGACPLGAGVAASHAPDAVSHVPPGPPGEGVSALHEPAAASHGPPGEHHTIRRHSAPLVQYITNASAAPRASRRLSLPVEVEVVQVPVAVEPATVGTPQLPRPAAQPIEVEVGVVTPHRGTHFPQ